MRSLTESAASVAVRPGPPNNAEPAGTIAVDRPRLAIAEPASLASPSSPRRSRSRPAGRPRSRWRSTAEATAAKGPVKLRLVAADGALDGFDKVDEATIPADKSEQVFTLKLKAGAPPRRVLVTVKGWLASGSDLQGVDARPAALIVRPAD